MTESRERWDRIQTLFHHAADLSRADREAYLAAECGEDDDLREQIESLLGAENDLPSVLDDLTGRLPSRGVSLDGETVGPYRIEHLVGQGGMGSVYLAERTDVGKRVALKVVERPGTQAVDRFLQERRVLARLRHPHIAELYDAGAVDAGPLAGAPFFAMEYVDGEPITAFCDHQRLPLRDRLRLVVQVGEAIQYAHQNLIVHRDLKPSNVLVASTGGDGAPGLAEVKLLDFGIAKLLEGDDPELTQTGAAAMTPAYAAPEQLLGDPVSTATDVYALGLLLYELLTGQRAHEVAGLPPHEAARLVDSTEPERPSTRVSSAESHEVAEARASTVERLHRDLDGDLDIICMTALRREPERRYASAEAFVDDIKRHLASLPIKARPETAGYRVRKFVGRHRLGVAASVAVLTALVLGLGVAIWQWRTAERAQAQTAEALAESRAVSEFAFQIFRTSDPLQEVRGDTVSARTLLERGAARVRTELAGQPRVQARMLGSIGATYASLGLLAEADTLLAEAVAVWRREVATADTTLATFLHDRGIVKQNQGANDVSADLHREALQIRRDRLGDDHVRTADSYHQLAVAQTYLREYDDALTNVELAVAIYRRAGRSADSPLASAYDTHAAILMDLGRVDEALRIGDLALATTRRAHGDVHPTTATSLQNLAVMYGDRDRWAEAEPFLREAIAIYTEILGPDHDDLAAPYHNLAVNLESQERYADALPNYAEALRIKEMHRGRGLSYGITLEQRALLLAKLGRSAEAEREMNEVLAIYRSQPGDTRFDVAFASNSMGQVQTLAGRHERALPLYRRAYDLMHEVQETDAHPRVAQFGSDLGACLTEVGRLNEAREVLRASYETLREVHGEEHRATRTAWERLQAASASRS